MEGSSIIHVSFDTTRSIELLRRRDDMSVDDVLNLVSGWFPNERSHHLVLKMPHYYPHGLTDDDIQRCSWFFVEKKEGKKKKLAPKIVKGHTAEDLLLYLVVTDETVDQLLRLAMDENVGTAAQRKACLAECFFHLGDKKRAYVLAEEAKEAEKGEDDPTWRRACQVQKAVCDRVICSLSHPEVGLSHYTVPLDDDDVRFTAKYIFPDVSIRVGSFRNVPETERKKPSRLLPKCSQFRLSGDADPHWTMGAWHPEGKLLAVATHCSVTIYDTEARKTVSNTRY